MDFLIPVISFTITYFLHKITDRRMSYKNFVLLNEFLASFCGVYLILDRAVWKNYFGHYHLVFGTCLQTVFASYIFRASGDTCLALEEKYKNNDSRFYDKIFLQVLGNISGVLFTLYYWNITGLEYHQKRIVEVLTSKSAIQVPLFVAALIEGTGCVLFMIESRLEKFYYPNLSKLQKAVKNGLFIGAIGGA